MESMASNWPQPEWHAPWRNYFTTFSLNYLFNDRWVAQGFGHFHSQILWTKTNVIGDVWCTS